MGKINLTVNGKKRTVDAPDDKPLLWILRDDFGLTGTKYGCGIGVCGACTVMVNGEASHSCMMQASQCDGMTITTIEGLSEDGSHPLQKAWVEHMVPQCGYCQSGQIMAAAALLKKTPRPTEAQILEALEHNICRCGTYQRIKEAVMAAAKVNA